MKTRIKFPPLRSFVIGGNTAIDAIFLQRGFRPAKGLDDAQVVIFQGGEDVSPHLYGESRHPTTASNARRDHFEFACYKATQGKLRIGICRGAQFLNVMNGGFLYQHVDGHCSGAHQMRYTENIGSSRSVTRYLRGITSTHHQLIGPNMKSAQLWGLASETTFRETGIINNDGKRKTEERQGDHNSDVEICYYGNTRSLCFQPHPEYNSVDTREVFFDCVERALAA